MKQDRYDYICMEIEAGRDAFATHPATHEEGIVTQCIPKSDHLVVQIPNGPKRCWDYHESEEMFRSKKEWPWR